MITNNKSEIEVILHPLVLLSAADHYYRVAKDTKKRVVGVLLGTKNRNRVDVTNSFAVPFEEDLKNPSVWFLDHNFLETMFWMFKKVNIREDIVGFYSSGPKIKENDLKIDTLFRQYVPDPVFVIIDVRPGVAEIPTTAYHAIEEIQSDGKDIERVFKHIPCIIEADEAEEVGVEHLLRDINDPTTSTLIMQIKQKIFGIGSFVKRLEEIKRYLENVLSDRLPVNNQILYNLQNILNLLPNMNHNHFIKSLTIEINDISFVIYLSSLVRAVLALHSLLQNKIQYYQQDIDLILDRSAGVITGNNGGNESIQVTNGASNGQGIGDDKMEEEKK